MAEAHDLTPSENRMAVMVLDLISDWRRWVHRRVETVRFEDDHTLRRAISVDFTLPADLPAPLPKLEDHDVYPVPLGLLRKATLRNFDLRDESGTSLPLMTAAKNGAVAAGVLINAAEVAPSDAELAGLPRVLPDELREELWRIANGSGDDSLRAWEKLIHPRHTDSYAGGAWRTVLGQNRDFMALASDLARNFIVLTPMITPAGRRRIVKLSYEQPGGGRELHTSPEAATAIWRRWGRRRGRGAAAADSTAAPGGVGRLRIRSTTLEAAEDSTDRVPLAVRVEVAGPHEYQRAIRTGEAGEVVLQVPVGAYTVEAIAPRGQVEASPNRWDLEITVGCEQTVAFDYRPIEELRPDLLAPTAPAPRWRRAAGWKPASRVFHVPAIAQAQSLTALGH